MADWKYGDLIQTGGDPSVIMVVGQMPEGATPFLADDKYEIVPGRWVGITISTPVKDGAWGKIGGTTWITGLEEPNSPIWEWRRVDDAGQ